MDFLRVRGGGSVSHAASGTGFAEAVPLLGLPLDTGAFRGGRAGLNYKYLDPAAGPLIHQPAFDPGGPAVL
jgi:hypothetical protein